jgi:DNA-binding transcriptional ArsR family regulator
VAAKRNKSRDDGKALRDAQAGVFKALGHPIRLKMVEALRAGPLCVCDLVELAELAQPTVSRHLDVLVKAGVLAKEREGTRMMVELAFPCILNALPCINQALRENAKVQQTALKVMSAK